MDARCFLEGESPVTLASQVGLWDSSRGRLHDSVFALVTLFHTLVDSTADNQTFSSVNLRILSVRE